MRKAKDDFQEEGRSILTMYMRDVRRVAQVLGREERLELARRYQTSGDGEAGEIVLYSMLMWVMKLAHVYSRNYKAYTYFLDLVQEGNVGIVLSLEKYDTEMGCSFSTYSTWWIRQRMVRFLMCQYSTVRLPVHVHEKLRRLERALVKIDQNLTEAERIQTIHELDGGLSNGFIERWTHRRHGVVSLDKEISDEGEGSVTLLDYFQGTDGTEIVSSFYEEELVRKVCHYLRGRFGARATHIIASRLELPGHEPLTLQQLGDMYSISRERVRQIESSILKDPGFIWFIQVQLLESKREPA